MVKSARSHQQEEEDDDEELASRSDGASTKVGLTVQEDGKLRDQKANTPRSKHSATEQRRRSKINERFQVLRDLIPENEQKRDKASFLLEVIQYIQFLQEKLHMYEGSYQGWNQETTKLMPWKSNQRPLESFIDQPQDISNSSDHENNFVMTPTMLTNARVSVESDLSAAATSFHPSFPDQGGWIPLHGSVSDAERMWQARRPASEAEKMWQARKCTTESNTLNEQDEPATENGTVSFSNAYSQRLLNTLKQSLQSSGVDLTQATISVQLDVAKGANSGLTAITSTGKGHENFSPCSQAVTYSRHGNSGKDSDQPRKRFRIEKS